MDMTDFRKLPSKCRQLSSMLSYLWYIPYQLWYILHISFDTWGYPWYIPCIWHLKIHIPRIWHTYPIDMTFHKKIIEHIYVRSIGYTLIKILILHIYLHLLFVYENGSNPALGSASLALGLLRLVSVCLVSSTGRISAHAAGGLTGRKVGPIRVLKHSHLRLKHSHLDSFKIKTINSF